MPRLFGSSDNPKVLCVGNYYEGSNIGTDSLVYFFSDVAAEREGIEQLVDSGGMFDQPNDYQFNHPLKAEAHDLAIRRDYMSDSEILQTSGSGISTADSTKFAFYVPPFFVKTTPVRKNVNGYGGILQTPFFEVDGSTDDPFNVAMAFGVAGHYINLENFVKDFATNVFPRLHHLSGAAIDYTTTAQSANDILYQSKLVRKRNLTVLPCDDGTFEPNFSLLSSEDSTKYIDSLGRIDPSVVNLDNLLSTSSLLMSKTHDAEYDPTWTENLIGFTPENVGVQPGPAYSNYANTASGSVSGAPLTIFQRLKDPSSDQVTFFDISNLYYGSRILPGSFEITDSSLTGSSGAISITLKDDGLGNIYRADANTPPCKWNSVGNTK
jgi:hypothetical protein